MEINKVANVGAHYMNELGVVLRSDGGGENDSLGRTAIAALIFKKDRNSLVKGVMSFTHIPANTDTIHVERYPSPSYFSINNGTSRDHIILMLGSMSHMDNEWFDYRGFVETFVRHKNKRPGKDMPYTIDQKIWFRGILSNFWSWIYVPVVITWIILSHLVNTIVRILTGTLKTYTDPQEFYNNKLKKKAGYETLSTFSKKLQKLITPTFAYFYTAIGLYALKSKTAAKVIKLFLAITFEKSNYVGKALCGYRFKAPEAYIPSRKNRWSIRLDNACNRDIRPYNNDTASNNMELAMLEYVKNIKK